MKSGVELEEILRETFLDITRKLSGMELRPSAELPQGNQPLTTLSVTAQGGYRLELTLCAEDGFLTSVAARMKRSPLCGKEETENYMKEYFNILCGRIVSTVNRLGPQVSRIGLPQCIRAGAELTGEGERLFGGCYECDQGRVVLQGVYQDT